MTTRVRTHSGSFEHRFEEVSAKYHSGALTRDQLLDWKQSQLTRVLRKVMGGSPFYKRHFAEAETDAVTLDSLSSLPFTTKNDLRREQLNALSGPLADAAFYYETTGTTGRPTPCPRDASEILSSNANIAQSWRAIFAENFSPGHRPTIGLMGPTEIHSFGDTLGDVARMVGSCNAKIWPYSPVVGFRKALELMRDLELEVIVATPGVCLNLARAAEHYGFDLKKDFAVKLFFVTGEMCTAELATNITSLWGAPTYNILYGSQEAFVLGVADSSGAMRFADTNYIAELLDPVSLESLGDRGTGELCVTMLTDGIKPLVRYRTGDLVTMTDETPGKAGLGGPRIEIIGRLDDRLSLNDELVSAAQIETAILSGITDCLGYQAIIDTDESGQDTVEVKLQLSTSTIAVAESQARTIVGRFHRTFGVTCVVSYEDELDQIVSTGAFVSWKAARIKDLRREPGREELAATRLAQHRSILT